MNCSTNTPSPTTTYWRSSFFSIVKQLFRPSRRRWRRQSQSPSESVGKSKAAESSFTYYSSDPSRAWHSKLFSKRVTGLEDYSRIYQQIQSEAHQNCGISLNKYGGRRSLSRSPSYHRHLGINARGSWIEIFDHSNRSQCVNKLHKFTVDNNLKCNHK